jgi:osmoprotectant transport system permease protein
MIAAVLVSLSLVLPVRAEGIKVVIGSKPFTESVILAQMLAALAGDAGAEVEVKAELGGTQIVWQALRKGEIDAYVEYTGTLALELFAGEDVSPHDLAALRKAVEKRGLRMSEPLGFENAFALAMKESVADEKKIECIAHLRKHQELKFGFSDEFVERKDGWEGLKCFYRLDKVAKPLRVDHNLIYRGLVSDTIQVADVYTTDAEIQQLGLRVLIDNHFYFPPYQAVILYRADLEQRAPKVVQAMRKLEGKINTETMRALNAEVQIDKKTDAEAAIGFLNRTFYLNLKAPASDTSALGRWWSTFLLRGYQHLYLVAVSLALAILISVPLGIVAFKLPKVGHVVLGVVGVVQTIPSLALLVFLVPLLGLRPQTAIAALFLYSLLPIVRNTFTGLKSIPPALTEASQVLGLPWYARLWSVELPLASPSILAGIKIAAVINVGTATIGALIGAGGFGQPILTGIRLYDIGMILQGAIPAAALALLAQGAFGLAELVLVPRGLRLEAAR